MVKDAETYKNASGVDIHEVYEHYSRERATGYDGEYQVFRTLLSLPEEQPCKILMNLEIPASNGGTTEIDLLMITKVGFLVFEMKNYKGTIYGYPDQQNWTQAFRTVSNHSFLNPLLQNEYHIAALRKMYPDAPMYSLVVFTNPECDIYRVAHRSAYSCVISLDQVYGETKEILAQPAFFDDRQVEAIFEQLKAFSKLSEPGTAYAEDAITTVNNLIVDTQVACTTALMKAKESLKEEEAALKQVEAALKSKFKNYAVMAALASLLIAGAGIWFGQNQAQKAATERDAALEAREEADAARDDMAANFLPVSEDNLAFSKDYIVISDFACVAHGIYEDALAVSLGIRTNSNGQAFISYAGAQLVVKRKGEEALYYNVCDNSDDLRFLWYRSSDIQVKLGPFAVPLEKEQIEFIKLKDIVVYKDLYHWNKKEGRTVDIAVYERQ